MDNFKKTSKCFLRSIYEKLVNDSLIVKQIIVLERSSYRLNMITGA